MTLMMLDSFKAHKPHFECFIDILGHKIQVVVPSTLVVDDLNNYIQTIKSQWATGLVTTILCGRKYVFNEICASPNEQYHDIVITLIYTRPPLVRSAK